MLAAVSSRISVIVDKLRPWLLLLALVGLCWFVAAIVWFMIAPPKAQHLPPLELPVNQGPSVNGSIFNLFKPPQVKQAPKPQVNFTLHGVFLSGAKENSSAVLGVSNQIKRYRVYDDIDDSGYQLIDVDWNQATLVDADGRQITVDLSGEDFQLYQNNQETKASRSYQSRQSRVRDLVDRREAEPVSKKEQALNVINEAVTQLQSNPSGYLNKMGVMATGDGYEVTAAMNSDMRNNLGLQPGDKVVSVNGQALGQPQQDAALLKQIQESGSAEIQIQRGGQIMTIRQQF